MPGSSASISDATVTQTLLGKFATTDPDTTCSVTSPVAFAYEVRKVTSPANPQQPGAVFTNVRKSQILDSAPVSHSHSDSALQNLIHET
ncbi:hypothetical protein DPMN_037301 [Dreissena polymorpha]|uniref:Uncharacterized protein n=1 Tax=Dreissena polymorpha TaxID=45954 RepID=A0A9D4MD95_DREPO|nr:hypothetical protein DPMN_037301 [Dreissena polymorpha]